MSTRVYGAGVVIFEGIMTLHHKKVVDLLHLKLFVDTDADIRLARRLKRDISERGRGLEDVFHQYDKHVKPGYQKYIGPSISNADIVIPRGRDNLGTVRKRQVPVINGPLTISFGDQYHLNGTVKVKTKTGNIKNKLENIANHVDLDMFPTINFVNSLETRELY